MANTTLGSQLAGSTETTNLKAEVPQQYVYIGAVFGSAFVFFFALFCYYKRKQSYRYDFYQ